MREQGQAIEDAQDEANVLIESKKGVIFKPVYLSEGIFCENKCSFLFYIMESFLPDAVHSDSSTCRMTIKSNCTSIRRKIAFGVLRCDSTLNRNSTVDHCTMNENRQRKQTAPPHSTEPTVEKCFLESVQSLPESLLPQS